jgi:hypothetical protein
MQTGSRVYVAEPLIALVEQMYAALLLRGVPTAMRTGPSSRGDGETCVALVCTYEVLARRVHEGGFGDAVHVVIDEAHFLATDRGPVLHEILHGCRVFGNRVVALSGTLTNENEMGRFLSVCTGKPTKIMGAMRRPIELRHFFYNSSTRRFSALRAPGPGERPAFDARAMGGVQDKQSLLALVRSLREWDSFPALIVEFSCRNLDAKAEHCSCLDLLTRSEQSIVTVAFRKMLRAVPVEDAPLFEDLGRLLSRGIALHHSHMPTLYLELVCALAAKRCVKLAFSSSTLSAGIDLPVRTVCLLNTRVPFKRPDGGGMDFDTIAPLLFHQLCGRAGRPGLETEGNVVIVGRDGNAYQCAQNLMMRPLPPVKPYAEFTDGDVLRALRSHRSIVLDHMIFEDVDTQRSAILAELSSKLTNDAQRAARLDADTVARAYRVACDVTLVREYRQFPLLVAYAQCRGPVARVLKDEGRRGIDVLTPQRQSDEGEGTGASPVLFTVLCTGEPSTGSARRKKQAITVPLEYAFQALELRSAMKRLADDTTSDVPALLLASVILNRDEDRRALDGAPRALEYGAVVNRLLKEGLMERGGALSITGLAAAEIRTCPRPQVVVDAMTSVQLDVRGYVAFASLLVGTGVADSSTTGALSADLESRLKAATACSGSSFNAAALSWSYGDSLAVIKERTEVSIGEFSRHIVRTSDLLTEMALAYPALGLRLPQELVDAAASVQRGLPFVRRGAGRESGRD